jgi:hypothetical protein
LWDRVSIYRLEILARISFNYSSVSGSWRLIIFELIAPIAKVAATQSVIIIKDDFSIFLSSYLESFPGHYDEKLMVCWARIPCIAEDFWRFPFLRK